jgi:hypothetical protein
MKKTDGNARTETALRTQPSDARADAAYAELRRSYPRLHRLVTSESPLPIDPVETLRAAKTHGERETHRMIVHGVQADASRMYGQGYPTRTYEQEERAMKTYRQFVAEARDPGFPPRDPERQTSSFQRDKTKPLVTPSKNTHRMTGFERVGKPTDSRVRE